MTGEESAGDTVTVGCMLLLRLRGRLMVMRMMTVDVVSGVLLLPLGASVLEPDLDLRLGQSECQGETEPLADRQIASQSELALERRQLVVAECRPSPPTSRPAPDVVAAVAGSAAVVARICQHLPVNTANVFVVNDIIGRVRTKTTDYTAIILVFSVAVVLRLQPLAMMLCVH